MDNKAIATIFYETADLMQIAAEDSFRIRSYSRAAEAIEGLGPKTIALIWDAFQICDVDGVAKLAREGKLRTLPRLSEKSEQKILKAIESYRQMSGRFPLDVADEIARQMM